MQPASEATHTWTRCHVGSTQWYTTVINRGGDRGLETEMKKREVQLYITGRMPSEYNSPFFLNSEFWCILFCCSKEWEGYAKLSMGKGLSNCLQSMAWIQLNIFASSRVSPRAWVNIYVWQILHLAMTTLKCVLFIIPLPLWSLLASNSF